MRSTAIHHFLGTISLLLLNQQMIAQNEVIYMWSGAITNSSVKVNAKLTFNTNQARLVISRFADLSAPIYGPYSVAESASNNRMAALSASGLQPGTLYFYGVESDGFLDHSADDIGRFSTGRFGGFTFRFVTGSCALSSNHPVYTKMGEKSPLLMVVSGDFHYANPNSATDINVHRLPYENNMLSQPASANFFKNFPLAYVWDDHDFSGDDSDSLEAGRANARQAYREYVPHYPLAAGSGNAPIYQAFTIGRIRFILSDLRSVRGIGNIASTSTSLSMMGALQKQWFKNECRLARDQNLAIAWVSSVSLGGNLSDNWGGFRAEREELSNFFKTEGIKNMFIISGDAHMLAIDNGTNHDYTTGHDNANHYPVFASAALNQAGSDKGELYSEGKFPNPNNTIGQYGVIEITDNGTDRIQVLFTGYRVTNTAVESTLVTYGFELNTGYILPVRLSPLNANQLRKDVQLSWSARGMETCAWMEIEHSIDGITFSGLGSIPCSGLDGSSPFTFLHSAPAAGLHYYRIRSVENSGTASYSDVTRIRVLSKSGYRLAANPIGHTLQVEFDHPLLTSTRYSIINSTGQQIHSGTIPAGSMRCTHPVAGLSKGMYQWVLYEGGDTHRLAFLVK